MLIISVQENSKMIDYSPFWKTLKTSSETTYTLINKYRLSSATIDKLRKNKPITTTTINDLCRILNCNVQDILTYVPSDSDQPLQFPAVCRMLYFHLLPIRITHRKSNCYLEFFQLYFPTFRFSINGKKILIFLSILNFYLTFCLSVLKSTQKGTTFTVAP